MSLSDCNRTRTHNHLVRAICWVFVYELSGCGIESCCSHLNFRYRACFEQGVPWHSGKYGVWIHSEICTWHEKNIQSLSLVSRKSGSPLGLTVCYLFCLFLYKTSQIPPLILCKLFHENWPLPSICKHLCITTGPSFWLNNLRRDIPPLILLEKIYLVISISCNTIKETSKPFNNLITYLAVSYPIIVSIMSSDGVCLIVLVKNIITTVKVGSYFRKRFHYNYLEVPIGRCSIKRAVLKNFATFTGKQLCWSLFLIKLQALRSATLLKRDSKTGVLLWIFRNF